LRAVLDPNVLISALLVREGAPAQILVQWLAGEFELVVSELLLAELGRALGYPRLRKRIPAADAKLFLALVRNSGIVVTDPEAIPRSPDPGDDYLLALAERERAVLVSGDRHLLGLADVFPVYSPRDFLRLL